MRTGKPVELTTSTIDQEVPSAAGLAEQRTKPRILFVDDEPNFLAGIRLMLRKEREVWDLEFAGGVDEAMNALQATHFDAVVSDVSMPVKTGLDLLTEMRASPATEHIPVVILTGNAEADLKRQALDRGATDLLNKPVSPEDLQARIHSVLRLKSYQDQLANQNELLEIKVRLRTRELERSRRDIVWRLAKAGEFRDQETGDHVIRVACCSHALASRVCDDPETARLIFVASPLHDIGKIGIPDSILLKPGRLSDAERRVIESHCEIGASILREDPKGMRAFVDLYEDELASEGDDVLRSIAHAIVVSHHEKWDGTGYPYGLSGKKIPLPGRIVAISDVYDALRSERPYKRPSTAEETISVMREGRGTHFDPELFDVFETIAHEFEEIHARYST